MIIVFLSNGYLLFELIFIVGIPTVLLSIFPSFLVYRHLIMILALAYIIFIALRLPIRINLTIINFPPFFHIFLQSILPSFLVVILILLINRFLPSVLVDPGKIINFKSLPHFAPLILYPLLSVPLQEIIFRWFYVGRFQGSYLGQPLIILISALVFGLVHLPFGKPAIAVGTFFLGLWWSTIYLSSGNLWYSLISHAIIGNTLIYLALYP